MDSSREHLPQLDAVRGAACLAVLLAHANSTAALQWVPDVTGVAGVGLFFALSGFLITRILLRERESSRSLTGFYLRRVARIFPVYYGTLAVLWWVAPSEEIGWAADFSFNWRYLANSRDYFRGDVAEATPVAHFWSLCVEEHFYWVWPVLLMGLPKWPTRCIPPLLILGTPAIAYFVGDCLLASGFSEEETNGLISRITVTQLTAISIGAWAAFGEAWLKGRSGRVTRSTSAGLALVALAAVLYASATDTLLPRYATSGWLLHLACGGLFLVCLSAEWLGRLTWLSLIGRISYGAYLFHLPVYTWLGVTKPDASPTAAAVAFVATLVLATGSFLFVERPILQWARRRSSSELAFGLGVAATGVVLGVFLNSFVRSAREVEAVLSTVNDAPVVPADRVRQVVVGSSHGAMGISPRELPQYTYNFASSGQCPWYDAEIVLRLLDRLPELDRVVWAVSEFSPWHSNAESVGAQPWRQSLYYHGWGILSQRHDGDERRYGYPVIASRLGELESMKAKRNMVEDVNLGWTPRAGAYDGPSARLHAAGHERWYATNSTRMWKETRDKVVATANVCRERGVEVVFVCTPKTSAYYEHLDPEMRREWERWAAEVTTATGCTLLDYGSDPRFGEGDFFDATHLNEAGAVRFSRILAADLGNVAADTSDQR